MLGDDAELAPRTREAMVAAVRRAADRHAGDPEGAALAARAVRRREIVRTAIADLVGLADLAAVGHGLSRRRGRRARRRAAGRERPRSPNGSAGRCRPGCSSSAMGRLGGGELGYGSDADVVFVHDPLPGADEKQAHDAAMAVVSELRRLLIMPGPEPALEVDADLRPEGRNGPLVRTIDSYAEYYGRWSSTWEAQALTRAVPVAGDDDLAARFVALIDPLRWPKDGLPDTAVREIRRIKARVEAERLPRGADPNRHLKLGRGGLSDVEWTVQLLQLQHAHAVPGLRTPSTTGALAAAAAAGLLDPADADILLAAWMLAARVRNATVLWRGRPSDALPTWRPRARRCRADRRLPARLRRPPRRGLPACHAACPGGRRAGLLRLTVWPGAPDTCARRPRGRTRVVPRAGPLAAVRAGRHAHDGQGHRLLAAHAPRVRP